MLLHARLDLTGAVDRTADRQVVRLDRTFLADRGLSRATGRPMYVYVTKHPVSWPVIEGYGDDEAHFTGGEVRRGKDLRGGQIAVLEQGKPICTELDPALRSTLTTDRDRADMQVVRLLPDGRFQSDDGLGGTTADGRLVLTVSTHIPMLLAAVDPAAEDKLVGLRGAVDAGRYLTPHEGTAPIEFGRAVPAVAAGRAYADQTLDVALSRARLTGPPPAAAPETLAANLDALPATPAGHTSGNAPESYRNALSALLTASGGLEMEHLVQTGPVTYDRGPGGTLVARTVPADPAAYQLSATGLTVPWQIDDTSFRPLTPVTRGGRGDTSDVLRVVGTFDPERMTGFSALTEVPLETYEPPGSAGADARSRDLLGDRSLLPDGNPGGYLASPPLLLTTVEALSDTLSRTDARRAAAAPISAVQVRVADAAGFSPTSRERVRVVAQEIAARTGLDVDVTYGASPAPQQVRVAAGKYGRPELLLAEGWSKKGAATAIVQAVDRKSAVLFVLVLLVCALFLVNAVTAGVRDRRTELAVLVALGWPARRIAGAVLGEIALIGLVAGLLSPALTWPLGAALHVGAGPGRALLAVPVAVGLALLAGSVPAARAARLRPAETLRPAVRAPRRARAGRTVTAMGLANLTRTPGRTDHAPVRWTGT
ncbi:FtsX-like permease family protein [Actinoplanes sp. CA-030573]|uniref:FtsX-like permease family protein n=1 Tax=Actinoplanes sp. CA-030573 TaxID=3239898 RepID=UPI003D922A08